MLKKLNQIFNETRRWMIAALALPAMALLIWVLVHFLGEDDFKHWYALVVLVSFAVISTLWWWWAMSRFHKVTEFIISTNKRFDDILNELREIKQDFGDRKRAVSKKPSNKK